MCATRAAARKPKTKFWFHGEGRGDDDDLLELPGLGRLLEAGVFGGHGVVRSHFSACDGVSVTCSAAANPTIGEPMISN